MRPAVGIFTAFVARSEQEKMETVRPLDSFPVVRSRDPEELRSILTRIHVQPTLELLGRNRTLQTVLNHHQLRHIRLTYGSFDTEVRLQYPQADLILQIFPIKGNALARVNGQSTVIDQEHSAVVSANTLFEITNSPEYERIVLSVASEALTKKLSALLDRTCHAPLDFHPASDLSQPDARMLLGNFTFLVREADSGLPPLLLAEIEQLIMVSVLYANRHNYSELLEQPPIAVAPWQVRRAEDFIEANWDQPIDVEAIAAATEVSVRSLFRCFKQSRGLSPMEFVKQVRLRRAHELLQRPNDATTVTDVALTCGFGDPGSFSRDYGKRFRERPSDTLRRARGIATRRPVT
jgi:AraC-like DNA-binding protein